MKHLAWTLTLLSISFAAAPLVQEAEQDAGRRGLALRRPTPTEALAESMRGGWQLVQLESNEFESAGRTMRGFLLIGEGFLSVEIHLTWTVGGAFQEDKFQSGIHEYQLDQTGILTTTTLIGAGYDAEGELAWEAPGTRRRYRVALNGNFLNLVRADGSRLTFTRRNPVRSSGRDMFGRKTGKQEEVDMFGRPIQRDDEPEKSEEEEQP